MNAWIVIAAFVGIACGTLLALIVLGQQKRRDQYIHTLLSRGIITPNEARQLREGKTPSELHRPYPPPPSKDD
jgi:hypothetical protein